MHRSRQMDFRPDKVGDIGYEDALRNADSINELKRNVKHQRQTAHAPKIALPRSS